MDEKSVLDLILNDELSSFENELVKEKLKNKLLLKYKKILKELSNSSNLNNDMRASIIKKDCKRIANLSLDDQKSMLFEDKNMDDLDKYINEIHLIAHKKKLGENIEKMSDEQYNQYKNLLIETAQKVEEFNRERAESLLKDALVELEYISGKVKLNILRF